MQFFFKCVGWTRGGEEEEEGWGDARKRKNKDVRKDNVHGIVVYGDKE